MMKLTAAITAVTLSLLAAMPAAACGGKANDKTATSSEPLIVPEEPNA
ncbi:hypothetical protein [Paracoccus sp. SCSIO 75233]|nr:hypothetical protein [Paracoccus sp. SCSIO 75233]WBU53722.1 hypothetical protein PAF12_02455 [Paracoccus sp. SCSIO 75233]